MATAVEFSPEKRERIQLWRKLLQALERETLARATRQRVLDHGFTEETTVYRNAQQALDDAGLVVDASILDLDDTFRAAASSDTHFARIIEENTRREA